MAKFSGPFMLLLLLFLLKVETKALRISDLNQIMVVEVE